MDRLINRAVIMTVSVLALAALFTVGAGRQAHADNDFLGQIIMLPYTFCPRGYIEADGQLLAISQYPALFSLLGTQYGGDGRTTFALPKLHGSSEGGREDLKVCICVNGIYPSRP
jgi:microcystin-dependent protein